MDDLPDALERLTSRIDALERRVAALEHPSASGQPAVPQPRRRGRCSAAATLPFAQAGGIFSVLGKAMLGIAGAYVLRAVAETSALPKLAVAAVAIAYAILWLVGARASNPANGWPATIYACTSAMILGPMLWELTLRFNVLTPSMTAGVLAGFVLAATGLAWKRDLAAVFWVANITVALAALALSVATHDLPPFIATLLVMALIAEIAAALDHEVEHAAAGRRRRRPCRLGPDLYLRQPARGAHRVPTSRRRTLNRPRLPALPALCGQRQP